jgi:hypothetical protein
MKVSHFRDIPQALVQLWEAHGYRLEDRGVPSLVRRAGHFGAYDQIGFGELRDELKVLVREGSETPNWRRSLALLELRLLRN